MILYNSFTGAIGVIPNDKKELVVSLLKNGEIYEIDLYKDEIVNVLIENGFFVPLGSDELLKAKIFHEGYFNSEKTLQLIIMPTEQCNFWCVYCYESFLRGQMKPNIVKAIKNLIDSKIGNLNNFIISWFGGEPTEALDVIYELSDHAIKRCAEYGVNYSSGITTNGYNLTPEIFKKLIDCKVTSYQITVDGSEDDHNKRRILRDGGSTYNEIMNNLTSMSQTYENFKVVLRVNYDPENAKSINPFLEEIKLKFAGDPRFTPSFHSIGKWGGSNDDNLTVCSEREAVQFRYDVYKELNKSNIDLSTLRNTLLPGGNVCYAAKPWSFVIGSDGTLYKCTVALDDTRNKVGQLQDDGQLQIVKEKFDLWVMANESIDSGCQSCFYRPSCQGASCPLVRLNTGNSPCPTDKKYIKKTLASVVGNG
ncbi:radical SAM protein [Bacillus sp. AFS053548]|uniref:radical SAM/SPASM domain-containing protein n=1 Tax=Bacillus sp. AFS053548 TaxID=2033505 RepID=UPI000BFC1D75|nr:radical SAM protein [Bacillus sp. AFS053548]PGM57416.1 radical SAM/SPASM domain-containing protein [Bacillus sp. AFS053548]